MASLNGLFATTSHSWKTSVSFAGVKKGMMLFSLSNLITSVSLWESWIMNADKLGDSGLRHGWRPLTVLVDFVNRSICGHWEPTIGRKNGGRGRPTILFGLQTRRTLRYRLQSKAGGWKRENTSGPPPTTQLADLAGKLLSRWDVVSRTNHPPSTYLGLFIVVPEPDECVHSFQPSQAHQCGLCSPNEKWETIWDCLLQK